MLKKHFLNGIGGVWHSSRSLSMFFVTLVLILNHVNYKVIPKLPYVV